MKWPLRRFTFTQNSQVYAIPLTEEGYPATWDVHPLLGTWVSVFYPPISNNSKHKNLTLYHVYLLIKSPEFKHITEELRSLEDKNQSSCFKQEKFSYCCFSGIFNKREEKSLLKATGLICIDIDSIPDEIFSIRKIINGLPYTVISFISPSGRGIKVIFRHNTHIPFSDYYHYLTEYLSRSCKLPIAKIDLNCQNISSACFLPYDPECFINPNLSPL